MENKKVLQTQTEYEYLKTLFPELTKHSNSVY